MGAVVTLSTAKGPERLSAPSSQRPAPSSLRQRSSGDRQAVPTGTEQIKSFAIGAHVLARNLRPLAGAPVGLAAGGRAGSAGPGLAAVEHLRPGPPWVTGEKHHQSTIESRAVVGGRGRRIVDQSQHELLDSGIPVHAGSSSELLA